MSSAPKGVECDLCSCSMIGPLTCRPPLSGPSFGKSSNVRLLWSLWERECVAQNLVSPGARYALSENTLSWEWATLPWWAQTHPCPQVLIARPGCHAGRTEGRAESRGGSVLSEKVGVLRFFLSNDPKSIGDKRKNRYTGLHQNKKICVATKDAMKTV